VAAAGEPPADDRVPAAAPPALLALILQRVKVTGGELIADIDGDGPPVVLVHAGVCDGRQWERVADAIGRRMKVVRYDRRGFGRSRRTKRGRFNPALDLLELLERLNLERVVACGSSAGGQAVLEAAVLAPERFARLVLLAPSLPDWDWGERAIAYGDAEEAALAAGDIDRAVQLNVDMWVRRPEDREPVATMLRQAFENQRRRPWAEFELEPPIGERLDEVRCPVHLLVGEHDLEDFRAIAWHLADRLPQATAEEVPGAGHLLGLEQPELVAAAL
jgi:pimeloyl-ACP methyl ester carboxylesterase